MDWPLAISRNRNALLGVVAAIVALVGGREGGAIARGIRSAALALLRPAESAVRRLIVIAARGLSVTLRPSRPPMFDRAAAARVAGGDRPPAFPLFDRLKRFGFGPPRVKPRGVPRIRTFFGEMPPPAPPAVAPPATDAPAHIDPLHRRLHSLEAALADLPRQARRLARWRARRAAAFWRSPPMRPGHPPGHRRRPTREIDLVLRECQALAKDALAFDARRPDTS
jgi:hypothetical protein